MDLSNKWDSFLSKIKEKVTDVLFQTWFSNTKLIKIDNNTATIQVSSEIQRHRLKETYHNLIKETFIELTGNIYNFEYVLEEELQREEETIKQNDKAIFESGLKEDYTFDTFVVGESNIFAKEMGIKIAENPGGIFNPLFIYGNSGLGKTHLMHAIGNYISDHSNKKVLYVTSEKFVNDFINIYKQKNNNFEAVDNFKRKYRDIDVLMIDDIQYLQIADATQQEFFNTFNELHDKNKQIILSSDRSPNDLKKLEERLRNRFTWGLTIDILPPDFNLRMAILDKKLEAQRIYDLFPQEVKEYIANNCKTDIRQLEGAIIRLFSYATIMNGSEITLDLAMEALKDTIGKHTISKNNIDKVISVIADTYNITPEDIRGKRRLSKISVPRQIAMYICRMYLKESLPKIGSEFGGKDHTTVMHSVNKIKNEITKDKKLEEQINNLIAKLNLG